MHKDTKFQKGNHFGKGRPEGSKSKAQLAIEDIGLEAGEQIMAKTVNLALKGDLGAIKLVLDRIYPPRKGARIKLQIPKIENLKDLLVAHERIMMLMSEGILSCQETEEISKVFDHHGKMVQLIDFDHRLTALEEQLSEKSK